MSNKNMPDFIFESKESLKKSTGKQVRNGFDFANTKMISKILRSIGAIIIVVSASTFLFQHWTPGSDLQRFLLLLGFTSVLSIGGLFCGIKLKESKGARTLLGLTLAVTPVNFAIMGALLFSQFSFDGAFNALPGYATWIAASPGMAVLATLGGIAVLAPLAHFSFLTLGHNRAKLLSTTFLISNLVLLVPTRQPNIIAGLLLLLIAVLTCNELRSFRQETTLNTFEGRLSRGLLWLPALILVGRGCYFYPPSQLLISAILSASALLSFFLFPQLTSNKTWRQGLQACGAVFASAAWINLAELLSHSWHIDDHWALPLISLPIAMMLTKLSRYTVGIGRNYRSAAAIVAILGATANLLILPGLLTAILCLTIAIGILIYGYLVEQKVIFFSGAIGTLLGIGYHLKSAINHFSLTGWSSLMIIGVLSIIGASLLEGNNGRLREKTMQIRNTLKGWEK